MKVTKSTLVDDLIVAAGLTVFLAIFLFKATDALPVAAPAQHTTLTVTTQPISTPAAPQSTENVAEEQPAMTATQLQ
jgi:hypothetical protein